MHPHSSGTGVAECFMQGHDAWTTNPFIRWVALEQPLCAGHCAQATKLLSSWSLHFSTFSKGSKAEEDAVSHAQTYS